MVYFNLNWNFYPVKKLQKEKTNFVVKIQYSYWLQADWLFLRGEQDKVEKI